MRISDLTVRRRLALLGLFTNVLLVVVVALAAYTANSLTQRLDDSLKQQQAIEAAGDTTRSAQLFFRAETQALQSLLLQGGDATARAGHAKAVEAAAAEVDSRLALLERQLPVLGLPADPATEARGLHHEAHRRYLAAIAAYGGEPGSAFAVQRELQGADQATTQRLEELNEAIRQYSEGAAMWANTLAQEERFESLRALGILAVLALVASFAVGYLNSRSIVPQLARVVDLVKQVSTGDLTAKIETGRKDELGQVIRSLHDMNTALLDVVSRVQRGAAAVRRSSAEIADSNGELSSRTEEQASNLEQTAASIEEMTATVDQNAQHARRADELAREAAGVAQRGGKVVGDMVSVMEEVQGRSRRIGEIIGLIDSIAFQTNILALNAAVEAARAGESGRGFAVVASEVRMLAHRSAEAAKQIKDLIQGATRSIDSGAALAGDAGRAMDEITASVGSVSAIIGEIAAATKEQQTGISQINRAVTELDRVTQQNASMVQQSASSSEALRHMALELEHAVGFFRIHAEELAAVAAAEPRPAAPRVATVHRLPRAA